MNKILKFRKNYPLIFGIIGVTIYTIILSYMFYNILLLGVRH